MKSGYNIKWSDHALAELKRTFEYIEDNWTERELNKLSTEIDKTITLISKNPELFQVSNFKIGVRRAIVAKYNSMYYRKKKDIIEILSFFSNRQNPNKLKL